MSTENNHDHNHETGQSLQVSEKSKMRKGMLKIWIKWTFMTLTSYTFVLLGLGILTNMGGEIFYVFVVAVVGGFLSGIAQWMILPRLKMTGLWILGSFIGSILGGFATYISMDMFFQFFNESIDALISGAAMGAGIGIGQWLILRQWVRRAYLWIVTLIINWALIWVTLVGCNHPYFFSQCTTNALALYGGFVIMSVTTGAVVAFLLTYAKKDIRL